MDKYEEESWRAYYEAVAHHAAGGRATADRGAQLLSPAEIIERRTMLHWLRAQGFSTHFVASIMLFDMPTYATVRRMVAKYGAAEAARRCHPFTTETEYGSPENEYRPTRSRVQTPPDPSRPSEG